MKAPENISIDSLQLGGLSKNTPFILAISGGVDSCVLLHILAQAGYRGTLAHVNFGLRGEDSNKDEQLVRQLASAYQWDIEVYDASEEMKTISGESIQMAARRIRYNWFTQLAQKIQAKNVLLAHHADDQVETFFIRLLRGSGSEGLSAIKTGDGFYLHPLLTISKAEIIEYATSNQLIWRDDQSNYSSTYLRNAIRLNGLPVWDEIQPSFRQMVQESVKRLNEENLQLKQFVSNWLINHVLVDSTGKSILKKDLLSQASPVFILHEFLKEYGFSWRICTDIAQNLTQTHVLYYYAAGKTLRLDRLKVSVYEGVARVSQVENEVCPTISCQHVDEMPDNLSVSDKNTAWLSAPKLKGNLSLRKWQKADVFWPWGMEGRKLLSDYFTDLKLSPEERNSQWLLMCDNEIVWVVNRRIDRRFAAISGEKEIIKVQIIE